MMWIITIITMLIIFVSILLYYQKKSRHGPSTSQPNSSTHKHYQTNNKENFTFMTCPRCKKYSYVNKNNLIKICNHCGWNLTEPYINTTFKLLKPSNNADDPITNLKINEQLYIMDEVIEDSEKSFYGIAVYNRNGNIVGWLPEQIVEELRPKITLSKRILAKVKSIYSGSGEIEILVTNDLMKMWG